MPIAVNDHIEITVSAVAFGQSVINVINYWAPPGNTGTNTLAEYMVEFVDEWQTHILPLLSNAYDVQFYMGRVLGDMIWLPINPPSRPAQTPAMRYREQVIVQGVAADVGGKAGAALPTFAAISAQKITGQVTDRLNVPLAGEKLIKGGIRLGPIVEADTELLDGNDLTDAAEAAALAGLQGIDVIAIGGNTIVMEVLSFYVNTTHRSVGPAPTFARARVSSFLVNPFVSSQITRKQKARGGA